MDFHRVARNIPWASRLVRHLLRPRAGAGRNDAYDAQTLEVMRRHLTEDSLCVDVGAHTGFILRRMFGFAPRARHHAFEPIPHLAARLRREFPSARVHECALGSESGVASFQYVVNDPSYSGLLPRKYDRPNPEIRQISVMVKRLDDVIPAESPVSFIKIDVEGGEYQVIEGGVETIRRSGPLVVFEAGKKSTSYYDVTPEMLFRLLSRRCGLRVSTMARWLAGSRPFEESGFREAFRRGTDFYFIAFPGQGAGSAAPPPLSP